MFGTHSAGDMRLSAGYQHRFLAPMKLGTFHRGMHLSAGCQRRFLAPLKVGSFHRGLHSSVDSVG